MKTLLIIMLLLQIVYANDKSIDRWTKLKNGLYQEYNGTKIAFRVNVTKETSTSSSFGYRYITSIGDEPNKKELKDIVDLKSFHGVEDGYYYFKDKNHVYRHFSMAGGGWFIIEKGADSASFKHLKGVYFKDKNHIYTERFGKMEEVDFKTFRTFDGNSTESFYYAKDKNNYYNRDDKVEDENSSDFLEIKRVLYKK